MARLDKTAPRSEEETAKEMNWMAKRKKQLISLLPPSPSQQLLPQGDKRKITYSTSTQAAKRQKSAPGTNVELSRNIVPERRQSGLPRTNPRPKRRLPVKVPGKDVYDFHDDSGSDPTKTKRPVGSVKSKAGPSTRLKKAAIPRGAAHSAANKYYKDDSQGHETGRQDEEEEDSESNTQPRPKRTKPRGKSGRKILGVDARSQDRSPPKASDDDEHDLNASKNERVAQEPSASLETSPVAEGLPPEAAEAFVLDDDVDNDFSLLPQEVDQEATGDFELFGVSEAWTSICKGARLVGTSKRGGRVVQDLPELITSEVSELVRTIQNVKRLYKKASKISESDKAQSTKVEKLLADKSAKLSSSINELKENGTDSWNSNVIQDIYAHAIRKAIAMLEQALSTRNGVYSKAEDIETIEEMIDLQTIVLQLCEKAQRWKAKPDTDRPIRNSVRQLIYPRLRHGLLPAFRRELANRRKRLRLVNISQVPESVEQEAQDALEEEEERARVIAENNERLHRALDRNEKIIRIRRGYSRPLQSIQSRVSSCQSLSHTAFTNQKQRTPSSRAVWTQDEDVAFLQHLLDPRFQDMAPEPRYLAMLSIEKLQQKSVELLEERALYFKDRLLENLKYRPYVESLYEIPSQLEL